MATLWFKVPFRGNLAIYLLLVGDYLLACMSATVVVSSVAKSQQAGMFIVLLVFFVPGFFVSGLIQPVSKASLPALLTSYVLPSTHFIAIARGIFLKDLGIGGLRLHIALLATMALGSLGASLALFRKYLG